MSNSIRREMDSMMKTEGHGLARLKIKPTKADDIDAALQMTIDMAIQGAVDMYDNPSEYRRQMAAIKLVRETFTKGGELR